jgi:carboxyl-terminal processing protease
MRTRSVPAAALVVVVSAALGGLFGSRVVSSQDRATERERVYTAALAAIETGYVEPVDTAPLIYGSIDGMLHTLDPHSSFLDPKAYAQMLEQQEGHYYGIGLSIQSINGDITVSSLFEGSPAHRAGIRRGDVIARVGTDSTKGWTTDQVVQRIKGPRGTTVDIAIRRPGVAQLIPLTVARDEINIVTVRTAFMMAPGTAYIRLQGFSETTDEEMGAALEKLKADGMKRLILDLRENPGGPLDQAIAVANRFLHKGEMIVYTRGRVPNSDQDYRAASEGGYTDIPLIVLVNRDSASAAEIVTGSMQDHDRGLVIGETTFGKALVQSVYRISEGAALLLTTAHYYTPSGRVIQRPWDESFDEYLSYTLRDQTADRPHPASELKYTDAGRKVYGGGGIEPDEFIPGPVEGFNPSMFSRTLAAQGAFVTFDERFAREGDTRPAADVAAAKYQVGPGWEVTDQMVSDFKQFLISRGVKVDEAAFRTDDAFIKAMIHFEVDSEVFSFEAARRNISKVDPQVAFALGHFDEARKLLDLSKQKGQRAEGKGQR